METPSGGSNRTVIERVLKLRKQMKIDIELSTTDPRDNTLFPSQMEASECHSMNAKANIPEICGWLAWETAPPTPPTD